MDRRDRETSLRGRSILGGAACGLSYEGARADALAREERERRREAGRLRPVPPPQRQAAPPRLPALASQGQ